MTDERRPFIRLHRFRDHPSELRRRFVEAPRQGEEASEASCSELSADEVEFRRGQFSRYHGCPMGCALFWRAKTERDHPATDRDVRTAEKQRERTHVGRGLAAE
jgi:hypothetical protein